MKPLVALMSATSLLLPFTSFATDQGESRSSARATSSSPAAESGSIQVVRAAQMEQWTLAEDLKNVRVVNAAGEAVGRVHGVSLPSLSNGPARAAGEAEIILSLSDDTASADGYVTVSPAQLTFDDQQQQLQVALEIQALPALLGAGFSTPSPGDSTEPMSSSEGSAIAATARPADAASEDAAIDPENTIEPVAVAAPSGTGSDLVVANTGIEIDDIKDALAQDERTRGIADSIGVLSATDSVLITGSVKDEKQRDQVLRVVRSATEREVQDLMAVEETAAE